MTVYRFSIPIFIVSRTPIIHTKMFKTNQLFKPRPSYKSLCRMNLVTVYFAGDLKIVSSHQTRTREIRTGNVTELKYTDKQTSCKKASVVYGTQNQKKQLSTSFRCDLFISITLSFSHKSLTAFSFEKKKNPTISNKTSNIIKSR